jgi:G:T/U-mismatch repair DNA glycosylase
VNKNTTKLILGEFPGEESLRKREYYAHHNNKFWEIMGRLLKFDNRMDYTNRIQKLLEHKIGLWDIESCSNFHQFFSTYSTISKLFFNGDLKTRFLKLIQGQLPAGISVLEVLPSTSGTNTHYTFEQKLVKWSIILKHV